MARLLILLCVVAGALAPAAAGGLDDAEARYGQGDMAGAAAVARSLASAKGFALAARATLVEAVYLSPDADKQALVERAAADAEAALARDPATSMPISSWRSRSGSWPSWRTRVSAHVNGYARRGKALIDQALALDPDNAWAHALLGMWHLRIVARAGDALAASLYGASREPASRCAPRRSRRRTRRSRCNTAARALCSSSIPPSSRARQSGRSPRSSRASPRDAADRLVQAAAERLLAELEGNRAQ